MPPRNPKARRAFAIVESKLRLDLILYAFWALFWLLNGLDKFFKPTGPVIRHGNLEMVQGWFGLARDEKFRAYFSKLHLEELALPSLYGFGVIEVLLGLLFAVILVRPGISPMFYRIAFKMSILLFFAFSVGDILFGDRMELWEHGTFMILTLLTYQLYLTRSTEHAEVVGQYFALADENSDNRISTEEFDRFMARMRNNCTTLDSPDELAPASDERSRSGIPTEKPRG